MKTTTFPVSIAGLAQEIGCNSGETILRSALRQGVQLPHLCLAGECGSCRCQLLSGQVRLRKDISSHVSHDDLRKGFFLSCQAEPLSAVELAVAAHAPIGATLRSCEALNADILRVLLDLDEPIAYSAGQYAQLTLPGVADEARCYSFASAPHCAPQREVEFHIRRVAGGSFTGWLFAADRSGTRLQLVGPLGDFGARDDGRPLVCVAGGTGLAPIKALLEQLATEPHGRDVMLFLAARRQADLYDLDRLAALQARWPAPGRLHLLPVLSEEAEDTGWTGLRGYCTDHLERFCTPEACSFYLCGPPAMIDSVIASLRGKADTSHIHHDRFLDRSKLTTETT